MALLELASSLEKRHETIVVFGDFPGGVFIDTQRVERRTYPVEIAGNYHFTTSSRWKPFLGLGARYNSSRTDQLNGQINGGVHFQFTPNLSLKLEAKRLLNNDDISLDPLNRTAIGLAWRF